MNKFALAVLLTSASFLAAADETLPKADTILDRFVEVTGGKATFEKHHSEVMHGNMELAGKGVRGTITIYQAEPAKIRVVIEIEGIGRIDSGSNGEVAWENSVLQGARIKSGAEKAEAIREATFNSPLKWRDLYTKAETTGTETAEGHECYKVVLTPKEGKPSTQFFDKKTGYMIKTTATSETPMGDISAEVYADDYRKEGDVIAPHKLINKVAGQEIQVTVTNLEFNAEIPASQFELPAEVQALLKKQAEPVAAAAPMIASAVTRTGKLTLYMTGKPMATENYTIQKSNGRIDITGSANVALGPIKISIDQYEIETDDQFHPLDAAAKGKLGQQTMNAKATFADGKVTYQADTGQGPTTKEDKASADALVVSANFPLFPWSILAMRADLKTQDPQQIPVYLLGQAEVAGTVVFKGKETVEFANKTAQLNHLNATGTPPGGQKISLDFWIDDNRNIVKLAVPSQGIEGYQEGFEPKPPPAPPKTDVPKSDTSKPAQSQR